MRLSARRCLIHPDREAAVRCPSCQQFFCRECVTEHDQRFLCASCLRELSTRKTGAKRSFNWLTLPFRLGFGLLLGWTAFYLIGRLLLLIPPSVQDGSFLFKLAP
jgi:hypothetical protein